MAAVLPLAAVQAEPSRSVRTALMQRIAREPRPISQRVGRRWWLAVAASAALLLASGLGAGFLIGRSQHDDSGLRAQVATLQEQAKRETALAAAAAHGTLQASTSRDGNAWATFVRGSGTTRGYIWVGGLPQLGKGETYQAWFSRDGRNYEPSAVFALNTGGVWLWADENLDQYQELELTREQVGGAATPGPVVLSVDLKGQ